MPRVPSPEIQKRNIREAWGKLSDDEKLIIADELFGITMPPPPTAATPVEPTVEGVRSSFAQLHPGARVELLDTMWMEIARTINLSSPIADAVLSIADNMRDVKNYFNRQG
jgi:hypothetical protein